MDTTHGQDGPQPLLGGLEVELDTRLLPLWLQAWAVEEWDSELIGPYLRLAYATGYQDALIEARRGELYRSFGQPVPVRRRRDGSR